jgi:predicted nucleic-acid-binding protein
MQFGRSGVVAVDTNVLVRLLVNDQAAQHRASRNLFATESVYVADTVLLECEWILRDVFELSPQDTCAAFRKVCGLKNVSLSDPELVARVIDWHEAGLDFADSFHLATSGVRTFRTFDKKLAKQAARHTNRSVRLVAAA